MRGTERKGGNSTAKAAEFILRQGVVPVLVVEPYGPTFPQVIEKMNDDPLMQVAECGSSMEAVSIARGVPSGSVLLCHAAEQEHLTKLISMLKILSKEIQKRQIRVLVTLKFFEGAEDAKLDLYGISEIIHEPIPAKTLLFKLERHIRIVAQTAPKAAPTQTAQTSAPAASVAAAAPAIDIFESDELQPFTETVRLRAPLELESDFWLLAGGGAKVVGGRWTVRLTGPGPSVCHWVKADFPGRPSDTYWRWTPENPNNDVFMKEQGEWIFRGQRPEFQDGHWLFVSKDPELFFHYEGESYGSKLSTGEDGSLLVTKDSDAARAFLPKIKQSIKNIPIADEEGPAQRAPSKEEKKTESTETKASRPASKETGPSKTPPFRMVKPLKLLSDVWLIQRRKPKWIADRWAIRLVGPGPLTGRWVQIESPDPTGEYWQWVPSGKTGETLMREEGSWVFKGIAPKFQDDHWVFVSRAPRLSFMNEGVSLGDKLKVDEKGVLLIAWDSNIAKENLPRIEKSMEKLLSSAEFKPKIVAAEAELAKPAPKPPEPEAPLVEAGAKKEEGDLILPEPPASPASEPEPVLELEPASAAEPVPVPVAEPEPVPVAEPEPVAAEPAPQPKIEDLPPIEYAQPPMTAPGPEAVSAPEPPGPSLSPLALSLLVSELVSKRGLDLTKMCERYCAYLSASCGGLRSEIWLYRKDHGWDCISSHDGSPGQYKEAALATGKQAQILKEGTVVAPVFRNLKTQDEVLGALVLGGNGSELVSTEYARAAAQMVCGLLQALSRRVPAGVPAGTTDKPADRVAS